MWCGQVNLGHKVHKLDKTKTWASKLLFIKHILDIYISFLHILSNEVILHLNVFSLRVKYQILVMLITAMPSQ